MLEFLIVIPLDFQHLKNRAYVGLEGFKERIFEKFNCDLISSCLMTDLLYVLPDFPTKSYTHLLPSLEKHLVTTTDLLTLDALEIAKRAQLPLLDVRRLARHVTTALHGQLGVDQLAETSRLEDEVVGRKDVGSLKQSGSNIIGARAYISTLDPVIDSTLGGGIPPGCLTEIVGER